ncbi:cupin-like domain-containing protein [Sinorhizobium meliloti]|uniref:cupin-like domain-containing protein n=1 Tax=Rhizobium meliloti TaxID=382 RepID=UPI0018E837EA|nr:cupin-like domain-containing protein [Sinorhizobium meliloti]QQF06279.1 cupin-like domain-containing protein [Sinorhizobium meliloti]
MNTADLNHLVESLVEIALTDDSKLRPGADDLILRKRKALARLQDSDSFRRLLEQAEFAERLRSLMDALREKWRDFSSQGIQRIASLDPESFMRHYLLPSVPVVLEAAASEWPAINKWCPQWFQETFGNQDVEISDHRRSDMNYEARFGAHRRTVPFGEFLERVKSDRTNDCYLVAQNKLLEKPAFERLLDDIGDLPGILDRSRKDAESVQLWLGPAGSSTPIHHDLTDGLIVQVDGRKRVILLSPYETEELQRAYRNIGRAGPGIEPIGSTTTRTIGWSGEVVLGPGDILFVPLGWWHCVENLTPCISLSMQNLVSAGYRWDHPDFRGYF